MAAALQISSKGTASVAASSTVFSCIGQGGAAWNASETVSAAQRVSRTAGVFSKLSLMIPSNDRGASSGTFRLAGADGSQALSITAATPGRYTDITNTDTVAAGDLTAVKLVTGAGGTTFVTRIASILFAPSDGSTVSLWNATAGNTLSTPSTTVFTPISGTGEETATEASVSVKAKVAGTWRNLQGNVRTNTRPTGSTVKSRLDAADGTQVLSITLGVTGWFEDLTHSDPVAVDQLLALAVTLSTGVGNLRFWSTPSTFSTTTNQALCVSQSVTALSVAAGATSYLAVGGMMQGASATENDIEALAFVPFTASKVGCYVVTNLVTADSSLTLRKNAASVTSVVTLTGLTGGWFFDLTNSDAIIDTDEIAFLVTAGAGGTTITIGSTTMLQTYPTTGWGALLSHHRNHIVQVAA